LASVGTVTPTGVGTRLNSATFVRATGHPRAWDDCAMARALNAPRFTPPGVGTTRRYGRDYGVVHPRAWDDSPPKSLLHLVRFTPTGVGDLAARQIPGLQVHPHGVDAQTC
jgi:hypothetical protein